MHLMTRILVEDRRAFQTEGKLSSTEEIIIVLKPLTLTDIKRKLAGWMAPIILKNTDWG
jgi:hypothetical protein